MKSIWSFLILLILLTSCGKSIDVEDELYTSIEKEYKSQDINLKKELYNVEQAFIDNNVLEDRSWKSRKKYLEFVSENDSFPQVGDDSVMIALMLSPLNFKPTYLTAEGVKEKHKEAFELSTFQKVLKKLESYKRKDRRKPTVIANSLLSQLEDEDYKHPFFKSLILTLAVEMTNNDLLSIDEAHYKRLKYILQMNLDPIPYCGVCYHLTISGNQKGLITIERRTYKDFQNISEAVIDFHHRNFFLTEKETRKAVKSLSFSEDTYPFYTHYYLDGLLNNIEEYTTDLKRTKLLKGANSNHVNFRRARIFDEIFKVDLIKTQGHDTLKEVNITAQIKLIVDNARGDIEKKIKQEINKGYATLRNQESLKLFNESYSHIINRDNIFLNDLQKIRLLEFLFPKRIIDSPIREETPPIEVP